MEADYVNEVVRVDTSQPEWKWNLVLFDRAFELVHKYGQPDQPIGEVDWKGARIFINWRHPVKGQMEERAFLRTALAWVLAKEAANKDSESMMGLALHLLSYTTTTDG
jgi:hypothetical protein